MLCAYREGKAKIADVGLAQMVQTTHISNLNGMGTFAYAAPELLTGGKCNEVADIFSFGVLLWELVTGENPRRGKLRDLRCVTLFYHTFTSLASSSVRFSHIQGRQVRPSDELCDSTHIIRKVCLFFKDHVTYVSGG